MAIVSFVGAGPGETDLITLKGYKLLSEADVVIYAGSLINTDLLNYCKDGAEKYDSAKMTLDDIVDRMEESVKNDKSVVRLQTGDFSIYGSIREQIEEMKKRGIKYQCVPGVSSFLGAASSMGVEYTVPEVAQSVIITRMAGRTPVPEGESLKSLAQHQTSMVIFLSVQGIKKVVKQLEEGGYPTDTPAAVIYKATWPDEKVVRGTLADIAEKVHDADIRRTALIMVGKFLGDEYNYSHLYDAGFSTMFRKKSK
ncbi:cobalt-precorrin-4 methyltransferase [Limosilactobacillus reuteri]|uniref:Cobalt-precorrin-4 methyltransferase n=3 Tax=Limosilactobacillus reuteri TaxID=1598 RepID=A0AAP7NNA8_LIMRT|nr:cobalt-precorrin-4 methyltransferase [Limosilactobacillus reuteri]MDO5007957.1 cobalt-precorrin-4 methyltransferase [Lactobacillus johnsonii]CCC03577.1 precorrin-4 C11-methyltransferase CbiF [Limosilactobacillus reuteri subsp. suis]HJA23314.1 cobalt-precorrin-4 methyltransferase [Candidatus Limosilactobacillus intestinavium]AMY14342.1 cobalt-precorrin-4 C(11)-methyltransferase [Limosilactobacillus reuteri]MCI7720105.1 cobalt-precorrin-4 methyltransferase [Limosilactobacillus reuteri]